SGQMSLPAAVRHRWELDEGGHVEVLDLGFGVLTVPAGYSARLLDELLPAEGGGEPLATTNLWYARLGKTAARADGGALLGELSRVERDAVVAALVRLPRDIAVVPMRQLAWRMGVLVSTHPG